MPSCIRLLTNIKSLDELAILLDVIFHDVIEKVASLAYELEEAKAGRVILLVRLQVFSEAVDALGKNGDLNAGIACVLAVAAKFLDNGQFLFLGDIHDIRFRYYDAKVDRYSVSAMIDKPVNYRFSSSIATSRSASRRVFNSVIPPNFISSRMRASK